MNSEPGREHDLIGPADRFHHLGRGRGVGRDELDLADPAGGVLHGDLTFHGPTVDIGLHHHRPDRRRQHPADRTHHLGGLVDAPE